VSAAAGSRVRVSVGLPGSRPDPGVDEVGRHTRWLAGLLETARRVPLLDAPAGALVCDVVCGPGLDVVRRLTGLDDLNADGIAARLTGPATPHGGSEHPAHLALVDLRDSGCADAELGWLTAAVVVTVGAPVPAVVEHPTASGPVVSFGWEARCAVAVPATVGTALAVRFVRDFARRVADPGHPGVP
jgi:hypothetical protein